MATDARAGSTDGMPPRPENVPLAARWNPGQRVWNSGALDEQGKQHGAHRVFRERGDLASELIYEHGVLDGPFKRFHPNGELARIGHFRAGELDGEVIAYASHEPTAEKLRACCVPNGAWSMRARFEAGRCRSEIFYDEQQRRLLDDGSLYPDLPRGVPDDVCFDLHAQRWSKGKYADGYKQGRWSWWTREGELVEVADFERGKRHGDWQRFEAGRLQWQSEHALGVPHGAFFEHMPEGRYVDEGIVQRRGNHRDGCPSGVWQFETGQARVVAEQDFGTPCEELTADDPVFTCAVRGVPHDSSAPRASAEIDALARLAGDLTASGYHSKAAMVSVRLAASSGAAAAVSETPLTPEASQAVLKQIRSSKAPTEERLGRYATSLLQGAEPSAVMAAVAAELLPHPRQGLAACDAALALRPDDPSPRATRVLLAMDLGWTENARRDIARLRQMAPAAADKLEQNLDVTFRPFEFIPNQVVLADHVIEQLPSEVEQDLLALRRTIAKGALRMARLREALETSCTSDERHWFVPDLSQLSSTEPVTLESFEYEVSEGDERDTIIVQEQPDVADLGVCGLMARARREWAALCWLCWSAGLDTVELPQRLSPPSTFSAALSTAFTRHYRAMDQLQTAGLRSRSQQVPSFEWRGTLIEQLPREQVHLVKDEYLEMRAALYFAGDGSCRSLWQDDLRPVE